MDLGSYDGQEIFGMKASLRNTGDGLSESLAIEPRPLAIGDRVFVLSEATVSGHTHEPIKNSPGLSLIVILKASTMTIVDADFAEKYIDEQADKNLAAKEAKAGVSRLWESAGKATIDEPDLIEHHNAGRHQGRLVVGCPECEAEVAEQEAEVGHGAKAPRKRASRAKKKATA